MLREILFDQKPDILLGKMLDKAAMNQRVIASNIANVGTPGYQRLGVKFDRELARASQMDRQLHRTDPRHLPSPDWASEVEPEIALIEDDYWNGINNVNVEEEMVELARNQLDFNSATRLLSLRFNQLRTVIRGRQ